MHLIPNPAAFPTDAGDLGMSLRDWFAGQALAQLARHGPDATSEAVAFACYRQADAMLAQRLKPTATPNPSPKD